jgi:hypothetical protein
MTQVRLLIELCVDAPAGAAPAAVPAIEDKTPKTPSQDAKNVGAAGSRSAVVVCGGNNNTVVINVINAEPGAKGL